MDGLTFVMARAPVEPRQFLGTTTDVTPEMLVEIDWNDKSTRAGMIMAVNIACIVLIFVFVATRLIVRRVMTRQFFLDDFLVTIASVFTIGLCTVILLALTHGFGQHVWNISATTVVSDIKKCVQLMYVGNIFYCCAITFTKLSIIVSCLRIFPYATLRRVMYVTAAVTVGLFVASVPATIFQCSPVSAAWDFSNSDAKCYRFVDFLYASTAFNVATDLVLCIAPLPYFWNLQLPGRQKTIVSALFFIGGFACLASIGRLTALHLLSGSIDVTWYLAPSVLWTVAECTIGICCVSVPPTRPLFGWLLPDLFGSRRAGYGRAGAPPRTPAYALGSVASGPAAAGDGEGKVSQDRPSVLGEEAVPTSWLPVGGECSVVVSGGRPGRKQSARDSVIEVGEDAIEKPGRTMDEG